MTAYDPQARRARPSPSDESPVDGLLESVPVVDAVPDDVAETRRIGLPLLARLEEGAHDIGHRLLLGLLHERIDDHGGVLFADLVVVVDLGELEALEGARLGEFDLERVADGEDGVAFAGE